MIACARVNPFRELEDKRHALWLCCSSSQEKGSEHRQAIIHFPNTSSRMKTRRRTGARGSMAAAAYLHAADGDRGTGALCKGRRAFGWAGRCSDVVHRHVDLKGWSQQKMSTVPAECCCQHRCL